MSPDDFLILNGGSHPDLEPLNHLIRRRSTWQAMGVELLGGKDAYGLVGQYRGHSVSFWELDRLGDGFAGMVWGSGPTQGHGIVESPRLGLDGVLDARPPGVAERPWYFRARWDAWSFSIAPDLELDPVVASLFRWSEPYEDASYMEEDTGWECIERAIAIYRDPLVQWILAGPAPSDDTTETPYRTPAVRPALELVWRTTACWPLMASIAVQAGGPVDPIRRRLWNFGIHPRGEPAEEWASEFPFEYAYEPGTYAQALAASHHDLAAFDRAIADAIRVLWPAATDTGSLYFVR